MNRYVRKTERSIPLPMSMWAGDSKSLEDYKQLMEIENAIEDMQETIWGNYIEFLNKIADIEQRLDNLETHGF